VTLVDLLMTVRQAGITVRAKGDVLRAYPAHRLTPEISAVLKENKAALLVLLRRHARMDQLQDICPDCGDLFVDICGHGRCLACVQPVNKVVA